jgi:putative flippase GtrA
VPVIRASAALRLRSLAVSLATTALDAGLFALCALSLAGRALIIARWACGAVGALANYALNRGWAFRCRQGAGATPLLRYAVTAGAAVSLATALFAAATVLLAWDARLLHLLSMAVVWLLFTFPLLRRWVFAARLSAIIA